MDSSRVDLPFPTTQVLVVSDFNCPYCFTLNEWLEDIGAGARVRWVGIEHRPDLPNHGPNREPDVNTLAREVADVQGRAPEVQVVRPGSWQNSRSALLVQNALEDDAPELAHRVRTTIFRRYWQQGGEMSEQVVAEALAEHGLAEPEPEPDHLAELTRWWKAALDRVPCMLAPTGVVHRGLQDVQAVRSFVNSALHSAGEGPGCR